MNIPDSRSYDPTLAAWMTVGESTASVTAQYAGGPVAIDIETPGLHDPFTIKCVTAAWHGRDGIESILLDPAHNDRDRLTARDLIRRAGSLVLHNSSFDVPGLHLAELLTLGDIEKIVDTLTYARMAYPDTMDRKSLEALSVRLLGMEDLSGGMELAFKAAGYRTKAEGYLKMDIDSPIYRFGAMADTVCTLRLLPEIQAACIKHLLDHPFTDKGLTTPAEAESVMEREQIVNRVMLRRSAVGLAVDVEYMDRYAEEVDADVLKAEHELRQGGIEPGTTAGKQLVAQLDAAGELPPDWPRTPKGALSAAKGPLETLHHPLAAAHRRVAESEKVRGYLNAVASRSRVSGRLHPQVNVLGASATGRMSYGDPALQQFSAPARPIITDDGQGLTSIDWSQIEPVTLANLAGDDGFLAPFEAGADLYEPIQRAAGIDRKTAKVVLLATMYGQGEVKLAETIGHTLDSALQIKRQMLAAMPESGKFMGRLIMIAEQYGKIITADGRVLPMPPGRGGQGWAAFKATNYFVQGTAYSILSDTIARCHAAGLSEYIQLALHDELVVDTEVAADVREIMMTPPEFMKRWSGRTPVFRTDMADMGSSWQSV